MTPLKWATLFIPHLYGWLSLHMVQRYSDIYLKKQTTIQIKRRWISQRIRCVKIKCYQLSRILGPFRFHVNFVNKHLVNYVNKHQSIVWTLSMCEDCNISIHPIKLVWLGKHWSSDRCICRFLLFFTLIFNVCAILI